MTKFVLIAVRDNPEDLLPVLVDGLEAERDRSSQ